MYEAERRAGAPVLAMRDLGHCNCAFRELPCLNSYKCRGCIIAGSLEWFLDDSLAGIDDLAVLRRAVATLPTSLLPPAPLCPRSTSP